MDLAIVSKIMQNVVSNAAAETSFSPTKCNNYWALCKTWNGMDWNGME